MTPSASGRLRRALAVTATLLSPWLHAAAPSVDVTGPVNQALATFEVPGMAVAVVHADQVLAAGSGTADLATGEPVDEHTRYQIGSVSKAFTAAALALLADGGRLDWDDPVIDHLPEFRMRDPWVTREFTVVDLLTHRSGLPLGAGDLLLFPEGKTNTAEVIRALRHLQPTSSFRSEYAYDNLLYVVAGELIARVSGQAFPAFLEEHLLQPLGMTDCAASLDRLPGEGRLAIPHVLVDGERQPTGSRLTPLVAPAGGIVCSARSMARWMSFVLAEGVTADGRRLISEAQFDRLTRPVTLLDVPSYLAEHAGASLAAYALGWNVSTFHGEPLLSHGGGVWGMTTFLAILPRRQVAVFATGNLLSAAPRAVVNDILEQALDLPEAARNDWIAIIDALTRERGAAARDAVEEAFAARDADSGPSLPLSGYAGSYRDPWYGDVSLTVGGDGRLHFASPRNPPLTGPLEHFQHDTFVVRWTDRQLMADAYVTFTLAPDGRIERMRMQAVSPATDFSFDFHDLDFRPVDRP